MLDPEIYKQELLEHLNTKVIKDVSVLWAYTKEYYLRKKISQGGSYHSSGDKIHVMIRINKDICDYYVYLNELKENKS